VLGRAADVLGQPRDVLAGLVSLGQRARRAAVAAQHARFAPEITAALAWYRQLWGSDPPARLPGDLLDDERPAPAPDRPAKEAHHA
jgi:hypothetical protein